MHAPENNTSIKGCKLVLVEVIIRFWCHNNVGL